MTDVFSSSHSSLSCKSSLQILIPKTLKGAETLHLETYIPFLITSLIKTKKEAESDAKIGGLTEEHISKIQTERDLLYDNREFTSSEILTLHFLNNEDASTALSFCNKYGLTMSELVTIILKNIIKQGRGDKCQLEHQ